MNSIERIEYLLKNYYKTFLDGIASTLILAIVGTLVGLVIGILFSLLRNIEFNKDDPWYTKVFKGIGKGFSSIYVNFFRGTPMMVQAMIVFFAAPRIGINWTDFEPYWVFNGYFVCGLFVITINTGAYMSEIIRSGLNGVDKGQLESARALGMTYAQAMVKIILPQAIRNSLPTILNEYIVNVKDSSVLNVIGLTELYRSVSIATNTNYFKVEGYIIVAIIYLILTLFATLVVKIIQNKLDGKKTSFINIFFHTKPRPEVE